MAKIQQTHLSQAIRKVNVISKTEGQQLLDELALEQPELYLSFMSDKSRKIHCICCLLSTY